MENVQKVLLQVVGGASRKCMEKTRKSAGKSFKGGPFADKEKGQVFDATEDHVVGPNQTWKSDKYWQSTDLSFNFRIWKGDMIKMITKYIINFD